MVGSGTLLQRLRGAVGPAGVGAACLAVLVSCSGGGGKGPECSFFSNTCNLTNLPPYTPPPDAFILPKVGRTLQVGDTEVFRVLFSNLQNPTFQWRRSANRGVSYTDISGATGDSYTVSSVQLADDGTTFRVDVRGTGDVLLSPTALMTVSSMPPVTFEDGEFLAADWIVSATISPTQNGPVHSEDRSLTNGNPGAFRTMVHSMPGGDSSLRVFHASRLAVYDAATQGAIYLIDYREDCLVFGTTGDANSLTTQLLVEQGGRKFISEFAHTCSVVSWSSTGFVSLAAANLKLFEGPACGATEACPDFSAGAQPLRFGYLRRTGQLGGGPRVINHGIDNWRIAVWRR